MIKTTLFLGLFFSVALNASAQHKKVSVSSAHPILGQATKSDPISAEFLGELSPVSVDLNWKPLLNNKGITHHSKQKDEKLAALKAEKMLLKSQSNYKSNEEENSSIDALITPVLATNFAGNSNTGYSPMDNSIAISNGGKIVSVANNSIEFYSSTGSMTFSNSLDGFFADASITNVCDPLVIYDSGSDRFIFFAQECSGASGNSKILICFSQTNDPNGNWFKYKLTGNPANNSTWFDYPKMAVSNNELYISGNSFNNSGSFVQALIYQIPKAAGYAGGSLVFQFWNNITSSPFTILPVSYGQLGNYGPGCLFVSTESFGSSTVDLFELTDDMSASNEVLNHFSIATTAYSPAGNANQKGTSTVLDNGDCRALSGFYLNGIIHFVFHSDAGSGFNGINYNRLDLVSATNTSKMFGLTNFDYSYPSVASFATTDTDPSVMIGFGKSGSTVFPEIRVVSCDQNMAFGASTLVKGGANFAEYTAVSGGTERWGDYTGVARKHNSTNASVWLNGMYGSSSNDWSTWIAQITGPTGVGINENTINKKVEVFPNPIYAEFKTQFDLSSPCTISIDIFDFEGKLVTKLYHGQATAGKNMFTFNKAQLASGTYVLKITSNLETLKDEKIIITQ